MFSLICFTKSDATREIDLRGENLPESTRGKFISGFLSPDPEEKGHTEENRVWVFTTLLHPGYPIDGNR